MRILFQAGWLAASILVVAAQTPKQPPPPPRQPIPFSHKIHAGKLELKCELCHLNPDPGERMGVVAASSCMQCHSEIGIGKPAIEKLASFAKNNREIRWARVYEIPTDVLFSHRAHLAAENMCKDCHGQVTERDELYLEGDISMGGCINCHRTKQASIDCTFCHEEP